MSNFNIFIVSDNKIVAEEIARKILLSRKHDTICAISHNQAYEVLLSQNPELILAHIENEKQINLFNQLNSNFKFRNTSIIMITDNADNELLCKGFDAQIDDLIFLETNDTIFNVKIMLSLKNRLLKEKLDKNQEILNLESITEKNTNIFNKEYTEKVFKREYQKFLVNYKQSIFMIITIDINSQKKLSISEVGKIVKKNTRSNDIIGYEKDEKIYILLNSTDNNGAKNIFDKINNQIPFDCTISAAAMDVAYCNKYDDAMKILNRVLTKSIENENSYIFVNSKSDISPKFKKIKQDISFNASLKNEIKTKIENILTPTFFKMQSIYEPKLYNTKIKQIFNEEFSSFILTCRGLQSSINIKYEKYPQIIVEIKNNFKQKNNYDNILLSIEEMTTDKFENIIQKTAEEFRKELYKKEEI